MLDLRRRVQTDPASLAFAQLAEECRRLGSNAEAVEICRVGLARHPGSLSARVTLGRALIELGQLDDAKAELDIVMAAAPNNLAAIRGLAEIYQRRGQLPEALDCYKRALDLAKYDPDLEDTVERISQAVAPSPAAAAPKTELAVEDLFDFETLVKRLEEEAHATRVPEVPTVPEVPSVLEVPRVPEVPEVPDVPTVPIATDRAEVKADEADFLAELEHELRELENQRERDAQLARVESENRRRHTVLTELDTWLSLIVADRQQHDA